jgi:hypothetical protein
MPRRSTFITVLWLLAVALLPIRIANAHLHLCLDGEEPTVSYHVQDVPTHAGNAAQEEDGHTDRDIDAGATTTFSKLDDRDGGATLLPVAAVAVLLVPAPASPAPQVAASTLALTSDFDLRPPTRGPPLHASAL